MADTQAALAPATQDPGGFEQLIIPREVFAKFPDLPIELRLDIWKSTIPEDRVVAITDRRARIDQHGYYVGPVAIISARYKVPASMQVCKEARNEIKKSYVYILGAQLGVALPFNFDFDTLLMDGPDGCATLWSFEKAGRKNRMTRAELAMIHINLKHLVVSNLRLGSRTLNEVSQFIALETLILPANPYWNSPQGPEAFSSRIAERLLWQWTEWFRVKRFPSYPLVPADKGTDARGRSLYGRTSHATRTLGLSSVPDLSDYLSPIQGDLKDYSKIDHGTVIKFAGEEEVQIMLAGRTHVTLSWVDHPNHPAEKNLPDYDVRLEDFMDISKVVSVAGTIIPPSIPYDRNAWLARNKAIQAAQLAAESAHLRPAVASMDVNPKLHSDHAWCTSSSSWQPISAFKPLPHATGIEKSGNISSEGSSNPAPKGAKAVKVMIHGSRPLKASTTSFNHLAAGSTKLPFEHVPGWQYDLPKRTNTRSGQHYLDRTFYWSPATVKNPDKKEITPMTPIVRDPARQPVLATSTRGRSVHGVIEEVPVATSTAAGPSGKSSDTNSSSRYNLRSRQYVSENVPATSRVPGDSNGLSDNNGSSRYNSRPRHAATEVGPVSRATFECSCPVDSKHMHRICKIRKATNLNPGRGPMVAKSDHVQFATNFSQTSGTTKAAGLLPGNDRTGFTTTDHPPSHNSSCAGGFVANGLSHHNNIKVRGFISNDPPPTGNNHARGPTGNGRPNPNNNHPGGSTVIPALPNYRVRDGTRRQGWLAAPDPPVGNIFGRGIPRLDPPGSTNVGDGEDSEFQNWAAYNIVRQRTDIPPIRKSTLSVQTRVRSGSTQASGSAQVARSRHPSAVSHAPRCSQALAAAQSPRLAQVSRFTEVFDVSQAPPPVQTPRYSPVPRATPVLSSASSSTEQASPSTSVSTWEIWNNPLFMNQRKRNNRNNRST